MNGSDTPQLVLVHGIGGIRDAAEERREWLAALAEGARRAGHADAVTGLTRGWLTETRFADYSDLFADAGAQGGPAGELDAEDARFLERLVAALIDELGRQSAERDDRRSLSVIEDARAQLPRADEQAQGIGAPLRVLGRVLTTLLQLPGMRQGTQWASGLPLLWHLAQVGRYLNRREPDGSGRPLDLRARRRVLEGVDPRRPLVVIAHSLGSVVAFEALHDHPGRVPLFVTLGSPLATATAVLQRIVPQPPRTPAPVERWLNFWDRDDIVVGRPRLKDWMRPSASGVLPVTDRVDSDGLWVHTATKYLRHAAVAGPVVEALKK
ncbi:hypothetical protein [Streptomyces fungicidicus]|uniref:hypothetical protein n=1 Tax=Streptomyces fungicidicus TaxID=68203 RepID=UPI00367F0579